MNLDLNTYLPNSDDRWIIKNNIIYFHKYVNIAVLTIKDDTVWISLDRRIPNIIIRMINHLTNIEVDFFLLTRDIIHNRNINREDLGSIIRNYLLALVDEEFFDRIFDETKFDYIMNLTNFLTEYDCHGLFKEHFEKIKTDYLGEYMDWYQHGRMIPVIKKEYIRDFIRALEREIKINLFI